MKKIILFALISNLVFSQKDTTAPTIKGIHHVSLSVKNLESTIAFYKETFALKEFENYEIKKPVLLEKVSKIKHFDRRVAILKGANCDFEFVQFKGSEKQIVSKMRVEGPGITHVCYQIPMEKSIYEKVKTLGAKMVSRGDKPVDLGGYGIYYAYARDENNIMFEMEHFDKPPFKEDIWIGHVSIVTPDIDRLVEFYTKVFGIKPYRRVDKPKNPKFDDIGDIDGISLSAAWFRLDNMILELWQYHNPITKFPEQTPEFNQIGYHEIALEVVNIENDYKRLCAKSVNFLSKPVNKKVFFRDPDGNLWSLNEL